MERAADHATVIRLKSVVFGSLPGRDILFYDFENVVILLESTPPASMFKLERKIRLSVSKPHLGFFVSGILMGISLPIPSMKSEKNCNFQIWLTLKVSSRDAGHHRSIRKYDVGIALPMWYFSRMREISCRSSRVFCTLQRISFRMDLEIVPPLCR